MRYIGGKNLMLNYIDDVISKHTQLKERTFLDVFAGSGAVSEYFKKRGFQIFTNDNLYFSYVLNRGTVGINEEPEFLQLEVEPFAYLNDLLLENTDYKIEDCFIYKNYSPNEQCSRMYFQTDNALRIDIIRKKIEEWYAGARITEDEYFYLLSALIKAVPYVSNITGVYGAYLKHWDKRTSNPLTLEKPKLSDNKKVNKSFHMDANQFVRKQAGEIAYLDPPYNRRQYLSNYHILETIARYDFPSIHGITGLRDDNQGTSGYCKKAEAYSLFEDLIRSIHAKYVVISYNNEGLLSEDILSKLFQTYAKPGTFYFYEYDYRRYKNKIPNNTNGLKEQIYIFEKEQKK